MGAGIRSASPTETHTTLQTLKSDLPSPWLCSNLVEVPQHCLLLDEFLLFLLVEAGALLCSVHSSSKSPKVGSAIVTLYSLGCLSRLRRRLFLFLIGNYLPRHSPVSSLYLTFWGYRNLCRSTRICLSLRGQPHGGIRKLMEGWAWSAAARSMLGTPVSPCQRAWFESWLLHIRPSLLLMPQPGRKQAQLLGTLPSTWET